MIRVRRAKDSDFEEYVTIAFESNINFYTLPKNRDLLENLFQNTLTSFDEEVQSPQKQFYIFVAEDLETNKLLGVSALAATSGEDETLYFYKREYFVNDSMFDRVIRRQELLKPVSYSGGPSEVCSLFVRPKARAKGVGKLLSLARFLFAASFPERFTKTFIAELRGKIENGTSPFWECVGRHFLDATFEEVQHMMNFGRSFIHDFLPTYPLYVSLLPTAAQEVIGKVDNETKGALSILNRLGFIINSEIDVIDAGPKLIANTDSIVPISQSQKMVVKKIGDCTGPEVIAANEKRDFCAIFTSASDGVITPEAQSALQVDVGDTIRIFDPKSML